MTVKRNLIIAAAVAGTVGVAGVAAVAQQNPLAGFGVELTDVRGGGGDHLGHRSWGRDRGIGMLCSDQRDLKIGMVVALIDGFVTFTPEQDVAWDALIGAVGAASARIGESCAEMTDLQDATTVPDRLERLELMLATGLDVVRELRPEIEGFHATLSPEQQAMLEALMNRNHRH